MARSSPADRQAEGRARGKKAVRLARIVPMRRLQSPPHRSGTAAVLVAAALVLSAAGRGEAYRLYDNGALDFIVASDEAVRWSSEVWPSGATLEWRIERAPEWVELFGSSEGVFSVVRDALSRYSEIPTADIRWTVSGMDAAADGAWTRDGTSRVFLAGPRWWLWERGAGLWFVRNPIRQVWDIAECDVGLTREALDWDAQHREEWATDELESAFRTCLGLAESEGLPGSNRLRASRSESEDRWTRNDHFRESPSYHSAVWAGAFDSDSRVGVSLLRPRPGWRSEVGGLAGVLETAEGAVAYAHVWALRREAEGGMRVRAGAFSNRAGEFLIEGLEPGDYLLWAHPISDPRDSWDLVAAGAPLDLEDAVSLPLIRVRRGRTTDGAAIRMTHGRE